MGLLQCFINLIEKNIAETLPIGQTSPTTPFNPVGGLVKRKKIITKMIEIINENK
jgi:hypothetical protein